MEWFFLAMIFLGVTGFTYGLLSLRNVRQNSDSPAE
jgi:VIT1/CCC1 family predicted Fe2+/Mn2+ transporter